MPPKKVVKQQLPTYTAPREEPKTEQSTDEGIEEDLIDISNYKHNMQNLSSTRTILAIFIGAFCGIVNMNNLLAIVLYAAIQLSVSPLILISVGDHKNFFRGWSDVLKGIPGSVLMFVCSWMISYNLTYTL